MLSETTEPSERFAHSEGYTAVKFSYDGIYFFTGGNDSLVRAFKTDKSERDQEAQTLEYHSDAVLAFDVGRNKLITCGQDAVSFSFRVPMHNDDHNQQISPEGTVARSTLTICDVSVSANGLLVAVAAHENTVSIVSLIDMTIVYKLEGHPGPVNSVDFSSDSRYLASAGCDGTIKIWDMQMDAPDCIQTLERFSPACPVGDESQQFKIRWDPGGNYLAAPGRAHDIQLIKRGTWRTAVTLKGGHTGSVTHLAWSPSGRYIASIAAEDSRLVVWDHTIPDPILTHEHSSPLCQVDWHPHANILAFTSQMGSAFVWDDILPKNLPSPHLPLSSDGKRTTKVSTPFTADGHNALTPIDDLFNDDKDRRSHQAVDDTDNDALNYDIGDDGESIGDEDDDGYGRDDGDPLGGFVVEDGIKGYSEPPAQWVPPKHVKVSAFQPGSTPAIHGRRYLALNLIGSVVTIEQDTEHNIIEIDFYDKSAHRDIHFRDTNKFSMASLSNQGCLFAAKSRQTGKGADGNNDDPDHRPSFLSYRAYSSWSAVSNWMVRLPPEEDIECVALSARGAAAVTSAGYLRLFTIGGVQKHIESLPSGVLSCAAHNDLLLIVLESQASLAHAALGTREREYQYILMSIDGTTRYSQGPCVVSRSSTISWVGFTEEGHPATCDSLGIIRVLHRYWIPDAPPQWIPVLDTKALSRERGKKELYWPVAIANSQLMAVVCKDGIKYPTYPKPILAEFDLQVPLLRMETQAGKLEEELLRRRVFYEQAEGEAERLGGNGSQSDLAREQLEQDKSVLRLIQMACKTDQMQRAMDLAHLLYKPKSIAAAIQIAMFHKQSTLAERLMQYQEAVFLRSQESIVLSGGLENSSVANNGENASGDDTVRRKRTRVVA